MHCFCMLHFTIRKAVRFGSVTQSCPTLCDSMNCSTPGLPAHHQLSRHGKVSHVQCYISASVCTTACSPPTVQVPSVTIRLIPFTISLSLHSLPLWLPLLRSLYLCICFCSVGLFMFFCLHFGFIHISCMSEII